MKLTRNLSAVSHTPLVSGKMSAMDKSRGRSSGHKIETIVHKDLQFFYADTKHDPQQRIKDKEDAWSGVRVLHVTISGVKGLNLVSTAMKQVWTSGP